MIFCFTSPLTVRLVLAVGTVGRSVAERGVLALVSHLRSGVRDSLGFHPECRYAVTDRVPRQVAAGRLDLSFLEQLVE